VIYPAKIGMMDLISAFAPVITSRYWFFTAYFAMFLISPMLNFFVHKADGKMIGLAVAAFLCFGLTAKIGDPFYFITGNSFLWLSFVYMAGAAAKKYDIPGKFSAKFWGLGYLLCIGITWLALLVFRWIPLTIPGIPLEKLGRVLISYCSPTVFAAAVCALGLFTRVRTKASLNRVITFFSGSAFSVYLIHDNIHVRNLLMAGRFAPLAQGNVLVLLPVVIASALGIYLSCTLLDKLRTGLFSLLRLDVLAEKLENLTKTVVLKLSAGR
jgi:surface polysaccharide O-acyltransferase-like enzyme